MPQETARFYTKSRRFPKMIGRMTDGSRIPGGPYTLTQTVDTSAEPRRKVVTAAVTWADRTGQPQGVQLFTTVTGTPPELAGSLAVPATGSVMSLPGSRHPSIPRDAVSQEGGTSRFEPPGAADGVGWIFSNTTGEITSICTSSDPSSCVAVNARLLSGYVRFAIDTTQPTPAQAEVPPSPALPVQVSVSVTLPTPAATITCFQTLPPAAYIAYYCAVPVTVDANPRWSGRSLLSGLTWAGSVADVSASAFRVCRYTPVREQRSVPPMKNEEHPLDYANPTGALLNQNFLVIRAGNGSTAFDCPADDTGTPDVNGTTWHHQPDA